MPRALWLLVYLCLAGCQSETDRGHEALILLQPVLVEVAGPPRAGSPMRTPEASLARWSQAVADLEARGRAPADVVAWARAFGAHVGASLDAAKTGRALLAENREAIDRLDRAHDPAGAAAATNHSRTVGRKQQEFEQRTRQLIAERRIRYRELQALARKYAWKPPPELASAIDDSAK